MHYATPTSTQSLIFLFIWLSISKLNEASSQNIDVGNAIKEIRNGEYLVAERIILSINNYNATIPVIVKTIYDGSQNNADIILNFSKAISMVNMSLLLLTELHNEMKKFGHRDPYKLMAIVRTVKSEVVDQNSVAYSNKGKQVLYEVKTEVEKSVQEVLKSFMIIRNFRNNKHVQQLTDALFEFNEESSEVVINEVINEQFTSTRIPAVEIAEDIRHGCSQTPQIVSGLTFLFWKLVEKNDTNNEAILRIAEYISTLKFLKSYVKNSRKLKYSVNMLIEKLPTCAKNLYFAKEVCIRNQERDEYIFSSETQFYNTSHQRAVFTCDVDQIQDNGAWRVLHINHEIYFKNQAHTNNYLYCSPFEMYDSERRHIQTWSEDRAKERPSVYSAWSVELNGNYCKIKNNHFQVYLYASNTTHSDQNRYIFAMRNGLFHKMGTDFQWQIEDCA